MTKKTDDLKITDEELKIIQEQVQKINNLQMQVGGLEVQKTAALGMINQVQAELAKTQEMLEENYGKVSVNLTDGTLREIEENEPDKKD